MLVAVTPRVLVLALLTGVGAALDWAELDCVATSAAPAVPPPPGVPEGASISQAMSATTMATTMIAGGILALACIANFVAKGEGTPAPFDPPRQFVEVGPYKLVRNPMYIGGCVALLGFGMYEQSYTILLFGVPWILLAHLFVILYEEPHLRATFGTTYDAYCCSVRRWVPRRFPTT